MNRSRRIAFAGFFAMAMAGVAPVAQAAVDDAKLLQMEWNDILKEARGQTVRWWLWAGDAGVNQYVDEWVAPRVKELYGIELKRVPIKDTAEGVQQVSTRPAYSPLRLGLQQRDQLVWRTELALPKTWRGLLEPPWRNMTARRSRKPLMKRLLPNLVVP